MEDSGVVLKAWEDSMLIDLNAKKFFLLFITYPINNSIIIITN